MLQRLSIKNYAIIESVDLDFDSGFNIITGEPTTKIKQNVPEKYKNQV